MEIETSTQLYPRELKQETICGLVLDMLKERNNVLCQNKSNDGRVFFRNGSAAYLDLMRYVEWCLPECKGVMEAVACDRAAGYILEDAVQKVEQFLQEKYPGVQCFMYKNNVSSATDSTSQVTYGTHENYSLLAQPAKEHMHHHYALLDTLSKQYLSEGPINLYNGVIAASVMLIPFLVSRQILCGAGSIVQKPEPHYEISQRAQFMHCDISQSTTKMRGIVNTRDEPHAKDYYRVHLTCGDANMLEYATVLKLGTTGLMIRMIEEQHFHPQSLIVKNPWLVFQDISKDTQLREKYTVFCYNTEKQFSAIDIQQYFLDTVVDFIAKQGSNAETENLLEYWQATLDALRKNPENLFGKVDWITKKILLDNVKKKWQSVSSLAGVDLRYHLLNRKKGLFYKLEERHPEWRLTSEEKVLYYKDNAPATRAATRTKTVDMLRKENKIISAVTWGHIYDETNGLLTTLEDPF